MRACSDLAGACSGMAEIRPRALCGRELTRPGRSVETTKEEGIPSAGPSPKLPSLRWRNAHDLARCSDIYGTVTGGSKTLKSSVATALTTRRRAMRRSPRVVPNLRFRLVKAQRIGRPGRRVRAGGPGNVRTVLDAVPDHILTAALAACTWTRRLDGTMAGPLQMLRSKRASYLLQRAGGELRYSLQESPELAGVHRVLSSYQRPKCSSYHA